MTTKIPFVTNDIPCMTLFSHAIKKIHSNKMLKNQPFYALTKLNSEILGLDVEKVIVYKLSPVFYVFIQTQQKSFCIKKPT